MEENTMLTEIVSAIVGALVTTLRTLIINRITRKDGAAQLDALLKAQCYQEVQENLAILRTAGTGPFRGTEGLRHAASVVQSLKTVALTTLWENVNKLSGLKSVDEKTFLAATAIRQHLDLILHKISVMKNLLALGEQDVETSIIPTRRFTNIEKQLKELADLLRPPKTGA